MLMLAMLSRCSEANLPLEPPRNIEVAHSSTVLFCGSMKPGEKVVLNTPPAAREARPSVLTIKENGRLLATSHACCLFAHPNEICNIVRLMHTADSPGCLCDAAAPICRDDFSSSGSGIDMSASADDADTDSLNLPSGEAGSTADDERSPFGIDSPCKETALSPQPQASLFPLVTAAAAAAAAAASHSSSSHHGADRAPSASPAGSPLGSPGRSWPGASHFAFPTTAATNSTITTNATTNTTVSPSPYNHRPFCPSPLSPARNNNSSFNSFGSSNSNNNSFNNSFNNNSNSSNSSSSMGYMQVTNAAAAAPVMPTASPHLAYAPSAARKLAANDWFHASAAMPGRSALNASTYTRADSSLHNIHLRKPQPQHIEHQPHPQQSQSQQSQQPNSEAAQLFPLMMDDAVASSSSSAARTPSPPFSMSPNNKEEKEAEAAAAAGLMNGGVAATTGEKALPLPRHDPMSTPKREDSLPGSPLVEKHLRNFKNLTLNTSARGSLFGGSPKDIASPLMSPSTPKSPRRRDSPLKLPPCSPSGRMVKDFHRPILTIQEDATVDYSSSDFEPTPSIPNLSADQTDIDSSAPTAVDIGDLVSRLNAMAACEGQCDSADGSLTLPLRHFDSKEVLKRFYATELGNDGPCSRA